MRLPSALATAGMNFLLSTIVFVVFYALHGCWDALSRLTRGSQSARGASAGPGTIGADAELADADIWRVPAANEAAGSPENRPLDA